MCNNFSTFSNTRHDFLKKITENKMFVSSFSTTFVWNIFYFKKNWARYDCERISASMEYTCYVCTILMQLIFSTDFDKLLEYQN